MEDKTNSGSTTVETTERNAPPTKKVPKNKAKAQRAKASHPPTSDMVNAAIKELKDRKGSSLQAIKKYIASTYKVDGEKFSPFIKRYLKSAVTSGAVVQTKGKGASGSFKLSTVKPETKPKVQRPTKKVEIKKIQSTPKKTVVKKVAAPKKSSAKKTTVAPSEKKAAPKKVAVKRVSRANVKAKAQAKIASKSKKTVKAPAAKTKTPKPKKVAAKTAKATTKK